jgi:hypothetical protein
MLAFVEAGELDIIECAFSFNFLFKLVQHSFNLYMMILSPLLH